MDQLETGTTKSIYLSVRTLEEWIKQTHKKINDEVSRTPGATELPLNKWEKYVCYYFIETFNFPQLKKEVYHKLAEITARNANVTIDIVKYCINGARRDTEKLYDLGTPSLKIMKKSEIPFHPRRKSGSYRSQKVLLIPKEDTGPESTSNPGSQSSSPSSIQSIPTLNTLSNIDDDKNEITVINIGHLEFEVPTSIFSRLLESATSWSEKEGTGEVGRDDLIVRLLLRYKPLGPGTGFFWSMDKRVYSFLERTSRDLIVIEGFASPFNHNLKSFCSAFDEDMKFGSKGTFFKYIASLNVPTRMIANPPYTVSVLNEAANACINYIERVPGAECIMMYPDWQDIEGIIKLMSHPKCQYKIFKNQEYTVHDYSVDKAIMTPMSLIFFIISSGAPSVTIDEIAEQVSMAYNETVKDKSPRWLSKSIGSPSPLPVEITNRENVGIGVVPVHTLPLEILNEFDPAEL